MLMQQMSHLRRLKKRECIQKAVCLHDRYRAGRLGNRLLVLGTMLDFARRHNLCYLSAQGLEGHVLREVLDLPEVVDVATGEPASGFVPCGEQRCSFTWWSGCGQWRRGDRMHIVRSEMLRLRHWTRCSSNSTHPALGSLGIVMHMRGGDIMEETSKPGHYSQPPCAFYLRLAERFESVLIVTERDLRNPCIEHVVRSRASQNAKVEVQTSSIKEDACMLVLAENLAISYGTFGAALAFLNANLRNVHVPFGEDHVVTYDTKFESQRKGWYSLTVREAGLPGVVQHVHSFPEFNASWSDWQDRVAKMVTYPALKIVERSIPKLPTS